MDEFLRRNDKYNEFIRGICQNRLKINGIILDEGKQIDYYIESFDCDDFLEKVKSKKVSYAKSYFNKLTDKLKKKVSKNEIDTIISNLASNDILIDRTNVFLFYRKWKDGKDLSQASLDIKQSALDYLSNPQNEHSSHKKVLDKFKRDRRSKQYF
ncbi:MAG: hypothetical protein LBG80_14290 [Bacteroidales bacterium]|nr:hypothetical protein [Bacteroidales bacterium]